MAATIQTGRKHWEKEKLLVMSNFSFSQSVFKRLVSQGHQKLSLCGNGLTLSHTRLFLCVCKSSLLKTLLEKEKLLIPTVFFYPFGELSAVFIKIEIVVCCIRVVWERVKRKENISGVRSYLALVCIILSQTTNFRLVQIERGCRRQF